MGDTIKRLVMMMMLQGIARGFGWRLGNDAAREVEYDAKAWLKKR